MSHDVIFQNLKSISFKDAWDYQEELFRKILEGKKQGTHDYNQYLLFCEHPHVYTLGKSGQEENLLISEKFREEKQIEYFRINRGGDITYHGPGQLVGYPIINLEEYRLGVKSYISSIEEVIIQTLREYGIESTRLDGNIGVWLDVDNPQKTRKICAIGVRTSRFVTMHGFAFNINTDLQYFDYINPCGITDKGVTTMQKELGRELDFDEVSSIVKQKFSEVFGMQFFDKE